MKLCYNQATTKNNSTLKNDLDLCEKYGYDYIEIRLDMLREYLSSHTAGELKSFFSASRLKPYALNALEDVLFNSPQQWELQLQNLELLTRIGREVGCKKIVVVPTADVGDKTVGEIRTEAVRVLRELCRLSPDFMFAFEFVGYPNMSVNTFGQTRDIIKEAGLENAGIVLDCFHFHAMGSLLKDIRTLDKSKIFILHIDDSEDLPIGALRDRHRLWPGEGAINLNGIFTALKDIGYEEMASVELFRPEYYEMDPSESIRIAKEKSVKALSPFWNIN